MAIELSKQARAQAIASIERWFQQERDERIGNIAASALLGYFVQEIGPSIYNLAVADVQERLGPGPPGRERDALRACAARGRHAGGQ